MDVNEIVGMLSADKQEAVKAELAAYVKIDGKEAAEKLAREHPHLKSTVDSFISKAVASHDERFKAETLPKLVDDELIKRNPPKDPRDLKLLEMENKLKEIAGQAVREKQNALAVKFASENDIPIWLVSRYIGSNDDETIANLMELSGQIKAWKEPMIDSGVVKRLDNTVPKRGTDDTKSMTRQEFDALPADKKIAVAKTYRIE